MHMRTCAHTAHMHMRTQRGAARLFEQAYQEAARLFELRGDKTNAAVRPRPSWAPRGRSRPVVPTPTGNVTELVFEVVNCNLAETQYWLAVPFHRRCHSAAGANQY